MDFYDRFKSFLGLPSTKHENKQENERAQFWNENRENKFKEFSQQTSEDDDGMSFNVFTNPIEMHRYFEQQMRDFMRSFSMFGNGDMFSGTVFGNEETFSDSFNMPAIEEPHSQEDKSGNLRDQFLKPGYERSVPHESKKTDSDVDGKFDIGDLNAVFKSKSSNVTPYEPQPRIKFFGQSSSTRTIQRGDGTIEIHHTVRDQQGNEETTVTHKQGDREYSVITRIDKDGRKEIVENFVNMDEKDKGSFLKNKNEPKLLLPPPEHQKPPNWFPFDKYFR